MTLTIADQLLLSSVKINPTAANLEKMNQIIPLITDWDDLVKTSIVRGFAPLIYKKLPLLPFSSLIPEPAKQKLQGAYFRTLSRSMVLYDAFSKVAEALTAAGIQVVALKGIYLSEWMYKDIGLRQFSDIDLLVKQEDGEKSIAMLAAMGYASSGDEVSDMISVRAGIIHYPSMVKNEVSVEIHINLHNKRKKYQLDVQHFIENSQPVIINHVGIHTLHLYDLIIFLCVHLDKHFTGGEIQFTGFIDITNLLDVRAGEIDWNDFILRCKENKCEETVFMYLLLIRKYFDAPVPEAIQAQYQYLLIEKDENLFCNYLHGFKGAAYGASTHMQNISQIKGLGSKLYYLLRVVFPTKEFMVKGYQIKNPQLYMLYYPYRQWIGLKGLLKKGNK